jgi:hypothetical protein
MSRNLAKRRSWSNALVLIQCIIGDYLLDTGYEEMRGFNP